MSKKGRIVCLFGAGAVMPWQAPSTDDIDRLIRESGINVKGSNTKISEYFFNKLKEGDENSKDINFESIINVFEELILYYSSRSPKEKKSLINGMLFEPKFPESILNFSYKGNPNKNSYQLQIPEGVDNIIIPYSYRNEVPELLYFKFLLSLYLDQIKVLISNYAYHTYGKSEINFESQSSKLFSKWMKSLNESNIIRMYTLNYDRLFKVLMERNKISVFEGFDCGEYIPEPNGLKPNLMKIINDFDCNCHYNLHGSIYWGVKTTVNYNLRKPVIVLNRGPSFSINEYPETINIQTGKSTLVSGIISGYNKLFGLSVPPFKQMHSAFDRDCLNADKIYVIGYSLGDEHINNSLITALEYNKNVEIIIVDPGFKKNNLDKILQKFSFGNSRGFKDISSNYTTYMNGRIHIHTIGIEEFMENI